ncbi:MAG TPA: 3-oxoacyl-ACP reductase FabG [Syntrophales bacterium]|nr:3-oxoacyl-ACP reductase FabG [Syntrophales bacterium]
MRLKDKVSIITGSGAGIGRATAIKFAAEGARVVVCDIDVKGVEDAVAEIRQKGGEAIGFKLDVTNKAEIEAMVKAIMETWGRVDVLVNNAGIIQDNQLAKMTDEQFDRVININLRGTYLCSRAVVEIMIAQKSGVLLNASSITGLYGNYGQTNYAASKWGVIGMVKSWAKELGRHGIRANAVCPGFIRTTILDPMPPKVIEDMERKVPLRRLGRPEEIANVYAFLASDEASYITNAVIEVSGGVTL